MKYCYLLILCGSFHLATSQGYEGSPCTGGNPALKVLLQKKELKTVFIETCGPNVGALSTSLLKADGKGPISVKSPDFKPPADFDPSAGDETYDKWTCMYAAARAVDGNTSTAWVEGVTGNGKGELLLIHVLDHGSVELNLTGKIEILAGLGKSPALFLANNRPKNMNVHVVRAAAVPGGAAQCGTNYESLAIVASRSVTLLDMNKFQPLPLPSFKIEKYKSEGQEWDYSYWLMLEVIDDYPGTKYHDTCISEIRNVK